MKELKFRVWNLKESKMYYRGYQKLFHVLLCDKDPQQEDGAGKPVKRAPYGDCLLLESTDLLDKNRRLIFEGDIVRIRTRDKDFTGVVGSVPDMFGTRKLHPLQSLLKTQGITGYPDDLDMEVLGNEYENQDLLEKPGKRGR